MEKISRVAVTLLVAAMLSKYAYSAGLTHAGAEVGPNVDGNIPAWRSGDGIPLQGWTYGKLRQSYFKYRDDKPIFIIDASNVEKYKERLSEGEIELIKRISGYTIPVYPTRRTCDLPSFAKENTVANKTQAKIAADGWSLADANLPGVPFPEPKSGIEAIWNFLVRYAGAGYDYGSAMMNISPRDGASDPIRNIGKSVLFYPWGSPGKHSPSDFGGMISANLEQGISPAAAAGQGSVNRVYFGKDSEDWAYFPGQRRVRRLPDYSYDAPYIGTENTYTADESNVFYGNPDRFNWKIIGKREMYVPYNNFSMQDFKVSADQVLGKSFANASQRRYELHRVWEIVGTVKSTVRHIMPKKTLYLDEDSWIAVLGDDYDAQGKVWRVKEGYSIPVYELEGACATTAMLMYDTKNGRYVADGVIFGGGRDMKWFKDAKDDSRLRDSYFTPDSLQAVSAR
ncbi:DUF1329 domain-containing protein [Burkholderia cenocepacia]|uniref:DUF1329 domain-containing protein n=1 Tax=Burkholderia cenocepacia TaxID=95486 RepID=UPI002ABDDA0A|nr:DUF1329 domain-containing protein [Burkholderia cenocepacia]